MEDFEPKIFDRYSFLRGEKIDLLRGCILPFDKPLDWSSFSVVNYFRIRAKYNLNLRKLKVGHAGTLDPKATGLLILCTGGATKCIERLMNGTKEYIAELKLGATTPSFDTEYPENATYPWEHISEALLQEAIADFTGDILQVPPVFSATSIGGTRAYKYARRGKEPELPPKSVKIHKIDLISHNLPYITLRIHCSRGTYIRSLARDLGKRLASGGYLTSLRRTASGQFSIDKAFSIDEIDRLLAEISEIDREILEERIRTNAK